MANEIKTTATLSFTKGDVSATMKADGTKSVAAKTYIKRLDLIAASEETVGKGDIGTLGWVMFKNVGDSGVIQVGGATGAYSIKLKPGEASGAIKWSTNAIYAVADIANSQLEMLLLSE